MAERNQDIIEQIARAEKDLVDFKNAQLFGKDVTQPKVIQRYNSDGTPTEWDVIGTYVSQYAGDNQWKIEGNITYTAYNQESPWASVYVKVRVNPNNDLVPGGAGIYYSFNAYPDYEQMFNGGKTITFSVYGGASPNFGPPTDPNTDRFWVKIYVLATDDGQIKLDFPAGNTGGTGTVVPLT